MKRVIAHVDMDAFFASVEVLFRPELKGKPVVVVGRKRRGVVSSASYEARKYGISSGMPATKAKRLCPYGVFIQADFKKYFLFSEKVKKILEKFSPLVEMVSIDEAYVDLSGCENLLGMPWKIAEKIREEIHKETGLTASVGIAPNKLMAKIASKLCKPNGAMVIKDKEVLSVLHPLPVGYLPGVGEKTRDFLEKRGIKTVKDLAGVEKKDLVKFFGKRGAELYDFAWGKDKREVIPYHKRKSLGKEVTFDWDLTSEERLFKEMLRLSEEVATCLRKEKICGRTVTLKVRLSDFTTVTKRKTLRRNINLGKEIYGIAKELYQKLGLRKPRIRLLGIRISHLSAEVRSREERKERKLFGAVDKIRKKYGHQALIFAKFLRG